MTFAVLAAVIYVALGLAIQTAVRVWGIPLDMHDAYECDTCSPRCGYHNIRNCQMWNSCYRELCALPNNRRCIDKRFGGKPLQLGEWLLCTAIWPVSVLAFTMVVVIYVLRHIGGFVGFILKGVRLVLSIKI